MSLTQVVNLKFEDYDVYIGRPSKWGNPFIVNRNTDSISILDCKDRNEAIERYREWILQQPQLLKDLHELKGKRLGCHCKPLRCHGDVLVELVEEMCDG